MLAMWWRWREKLLWLCVCPGKRVFGQGRPSVAGAKGVMGYTWEVKMVVLGDVTVVRKVLGVGRMKGRGGVGGYNWGERPRWWQS